MRKLKKPPIEKTPPDLVGGDTLVNMFDYLCSRVDWGKAALDGVAVGCMNRLFIELGKDKRKFKI